MIKNTELKNESELKKIETKNESELKNRVKKIQR